MARYFLLIAAFFLGSVGCAASSGAQQADADRVPQTRRSPSTEQALAAAARWMPPDTAALAIADGAQGWQFLTRLLPPTTAADRRARLRRRLSAVFRHYSGFDGMAATRIVIGGGPSWSTAIFFGDFQAPEDADREELSGQTVYGVRFDLMGHSGGKVWLMPVRKAGQPAMVTFPSYDYAKRALRAATKAETLAENPAHLKALRGLFEELSPGRLMLAWTTRDLPGRISGLLPVPRDAALSFGDVLEVVARDDGARLDEIQKTVDAYRDTLEEMLAEAAVPTDRRYGSDASLVEELGRVGALELMGVYESNMGIKRRDGRLRYRVPLPGDTLHAALAVATMAGHGLPRLIRHHRVGGNPRVKRQRQSMMVRRMADGAKGYFQSEQKYCPQNACDEPWHTANKAGFPVEFARFVFPGGTGVELVSQPGIPERGETLDPRPTLRQSDADIAVDSVLAKLNVDFDEPMHFRYTYRTGPDSGPDATATVIAEADFDGAGPPNHTVTVELRIQDMSVRLTPMVIENEFE